MASERQRPVVEARLREYLRSASFRPGERIPGERDLGAAIGAGRTALRPVLDLLVQEGALERRPQSGTYLRKRPLAPVRKGVIAIIAPIQAGGPQGAWTHQVISAIERTAAPSGIRPLILDQTPLGGHPCSVKVLAHVAAAEGALAAILIHPLGSRDKIACALALLHDAGVHPVVVSSRSYGGLSSYVYFDSEWGSYSATRCLIRMGHRAIGFAGAAAGHQWVQERLRGYRQALSTLDIDPQPDWEWLAEPGERLASQRDGRRAAAKLLRRPELTAVVAANDVIALGFREVCLARGIRIPEDISLIGFDNDPASLAAGLTTVERPSTVLGEAAARAALERIAAGPSADSVSIRLRPVLIERQSVNIRPVGPNANEKIKGEAQ